MYLSLIDTVFTNNVIIDLAYNYLPLLVNTRLQMSETLLVKITIFICRTRAVFLVYALFVNVLSVQNLNSL